MQVVNGLTAISAVVNHKAIAVLKTRLLSNTLGG
jgi:hypothetical protein